MLRDATHIKSAEQVDSEAQKVINDFQGGAWKVIPMGKGFLFGGHENIPKLIVVVTVWLD